jgi:phenylacetate-CoA ligase
VEPAPGEVKNFMQNPRSWFLKNVLCPLGDRLLGHQMIRRLRFLEQAQWWDTGRLEEERNQSLSELIHVAYAEVPFYRSLMDETGIRPEDVRCIEDLGKLSVIDKAMLRAGYPKMTTRATGQRTYEASTSGSTGVNFRVLEDNETAAQYRALFLLALEWSGWEFGKPHLQTGITLNRSFERKLKDFFFRCHYTPAFDLTDSALDRSLDTMERKKLEYVWGYPGSLYYLARRAVQRGWNRPLKSLVTWGDKLLPLYRTTIESAFKARVFDTYGCGEGIQIAAQCGNGPSYHVHMLDTIVELLDDEGKPVVPGEPGRVVLTRLHPGPMPLIRYQVGDVAVGNTSSMCPCGRTFPLLEDIQGRITDVVITPAGNRLIVHFFTGILEHFPEIDTFQVVQETRENLVIRILPTKTFSRESEAKVRAALVEKGLLGMTIQIEPVAEIPLTSGGKRRFVINKLDALRPEAKGDPLVITQ